MDKERRVITTTIRDNSEDPKGEGTIEIQKEYVVYPETVIVDKYSASLDMPLNIGPYLNAKVSAHMSKSYLVDPLDDDFTDKNEQECIDKVHARLDEIIGKRITEYTDMLDKRGISWQNIESEMKKGK